MSFGWSAGDIFTLVVTCYKIVENCREGLNSASIQLGGLQNDLEEFSAVLLHLHNVVKESQNIAFFDMKEMKKTIEACNIYLNKYAGLKHRPSFSKGKELLDNAKDAGLKIKQAVIFTTLGGDQQLQVLQRRLARHRQTLVLYLQILERNRRTKEDIKLNKRLSNVEAMVKDMHSGRRLSVAGSPDILPRSPHVQQQQQQQQQHQPENEDYEAIFKQLNEQKRLALIEAERPNNDDNLEELNDILSHLELIRLRVLNAAERTASSTAQRRTGSVSHQIALNRMLTPHHTMGTPPLRPIQRVDTNDSGFAEMLPQPLAPVREESSGLTEAFVESGHLNKYVHPSASFSEGIVEPHPPPISPRTLLKSRTLSVNSIPRPLISPSSSSESVTASTAPTMHSPRQSRTLSISSSEASFTSTVLHWQVIQFTGWVQCCAKTFRKTLCTIYGGFDPNGQVYGLDIRRQDTNSQLVFIKISTKKKRPIPQVEPCGSRHDFNEGYQVYFISPLDTEPKDEEVKFFFQEEKSLNKFESLVYGQELLLSIDFRKISSSDKTLSENQRLRLWRKGDTKSLLFYTTNKADKSKGRYHPVLAQEVHRSKVNKTTVDLKLQNNTHNLKDLKIEFENKSDLSLFLTEFLSKPGA